MKCTICGNTFEEKKIVMLDGRKTCVNCARSAIINSDKKANNYEKNEDTEKFGFSRTVKLAALSFIPIFPWGLNYLYIGKVGIALLLLTLSFLINILSFSFFGNILSGIIIILPIRFITFIHSVSLRNEYSKTHLKIFEDKFLAYLILIFVGSALNIGRILNFFSFNIFLFSNFRQHISIAPIISILFTLYIAILAKKDFKKEDITIIEGEAEEKIQKEIKAKTVKYEINLSEEKQISEKLRAYTLTLSGTKLHKNLVSLSQTTDKIILFISENERKRRNLNKFFEYYLPTTLDLLNKYEILLKHGKAGENVEASKSSIENLMKDLEKAFLNQFDMLFEEKKIDIDADISVMKSIMEKEGLIGEI